MIWVTNGLRMHSKVDTLGPVLPVVASDGQVNVMVEGTLRYVYRSPDTFN